jgi:hypothetical protein
MDSNWYKEWFLHDQGKNVKVEWVNIFIFPHQEFLLISSFEYVLRLMLEYGFELEWCLGFQERDDELEWYEQGSKREQN